MDFSRSKRRTFGKRVRSTNSGSKSRHRPWVLQLKVLRVECIPNKPTIRKEPHKTVVAFKKGIRGSELFERSQGPLCVHNFLSRSKENRCQGPCYSSKPNLQSLIVSMLEKFSFRTCNYPTIKALHRAHDRQQNNHLFWRPRDQLVVVPSAEKLFPEVGRLLTEGVD